MTHIHPKKLRPQVDVKKVVLVFLATIVFIFLSQHYIAVSPGNNTPAGRLAYHYKSYLERKALHYTGPGPIAENFDHFAPNQAIEDHQGTSPKRKFRPFGSGAALFVVYGAYRGGPNTFAVVGLGLKPLYTYGKPDFKCFWVPSAFPNDPVESTIAYTMLPDMNYGRIYTVVVVNCTFSAPVGAHGQGGELVLHAYHGDGLGKPPVHVVALREDQNAYNSSRFEAPYPYEYVYCGSPLYGALNAKRIREWMAYHVRLFGPRSHFIFHDAGGMHEQVRQVLAPWEKLGYATIEDVSEQAEYDGYYYNQFLILNDCLHKTKFLANWTFFFDVDEYIYVSPGQSFDASMRGFTNHTLLQFNQYRMSEELCQDNATEADSRWTFEKLVYRDMQIDYVKGAPKYAVQGRGVFATGVHNSQKELGHMEGEIAWAWWPNMRYYHYHNTIVRHQDSCMQVAAANTTFHGIPYELDTSMVSLAPLVKKFEIEHLSS